MLYPTFLLVACARLASASLPGASENILNEILSQVKAQGEKLRVQDEKIAHLQAELAKSRSATLGQEGGAAKRKLQYDGDSSASSEIEMNAGSDSNFIISEQNALKFAVGGSSQAYVSPYGLVSGANARLDADKEFVVFGAGDHTIADEQVRIYDAPSGRALSLGADSTHSWVESGQPGVGFGPLLLNPNAGYVGIGSQGDRAAFAKGLTIDMGSSSRLAITNADGASAILMGNRDSGGVDNPTMLQAANGNLAIGNGDSWQSSLGGTFSPKFFFDSSGRFAINNGYSVSHSLHVSGDGLIANTASSSGTPTLTLTRTGSGDVFTAKTTGEDGLVYSVNSEANTMQLASIKGGKNLDLWANTLTLSSGGQTSLELRGASMSALNVFHTYHLGQFPTRFTSDDKAPIGHLKIKLDNHYYGGFTFEVFMDYGRDWSGHGYATYYGRFMWVGYSTTGGRLHKITEFGASYLQNSNAIKLNGWQFLDSNEPADYLYLSFASNKLTAGETDGGWQPRVTVVVHDTRNTVQSVGTSDRTTGSWNTVA